MFFLIMFDKFLLGPTVVDIKSVPLSGKNIQEVMPLIQEKFLPLVLWVDEYNQLRVALYDFG